MLADQMALWEHFQRSWQNNGCSYIARLGQPEKYFLLVVMPI